MRVRVEQRGAEFKAKRFVCGSVCFWLTIRKAPPGVELGGRDYPSLALVGFVTFNDHGVPSKVPVSVGLTREELGAFSSGPTEEAIVNVQLKALVRKLAPPAVDLLGLSRYSTRVH